MNDAVVDQSKHCSAYGQPSVTTGVHAIVSESSDHSSSGSSSSDQTSNVQHSSFSLGSSLSSLTDSAQGAQQQRADLLTPPESVFSRSRQTRSNQIVPNDIVPNTVDGDQKIATKYSTREEWKHHECQTLSQIFFQHKKPESRIEPLKKWIADLRNHCQRLAKEYFGKRAAEFYSNDHSEVTKEGSNSLVSTEFEEIWTHVLSHTRNKTPQEFVQESGVYFLYTLMVDDTCWLMNAQIKLQEQYHFAIQAEKPARKSFVFKVGRKCVNDMVLGKYRRYLKDYKLNILLNDPKTKGFDSIQIKAPQKCQRNERIVYLGRRVKNVDVDENTTSEENVDSVQIPSNKEIVQNDKNEKNVEDDKSSSKEKNIKVDNIFWDRLEFHFMNDPEEFQKQFDQRIANKRGRPDLCSVRSNAHSLISLALSERIRQSVSDSSQSCNRSSTSDLTDVDTVATDRSFLLKSSNCWTSQKEGDKSANASSSGIPSSKSWRPDCTALGCDVSFFHPTDFKLHLFHEMIKEL